MASKALSRSRAESLPRSLAGLVAAALLTLSVAPATAEPAYSFLTEKRRYYNPDAPTSETLTLGQLRGLLAAGWEGPICDPDLGIDYLRRRSAVSIASVAEGDLELNEEVILPEGTGPRVGRKRPVPIPIATDPYRSLATLRARHPLAEVLPEFQAMLMLGNPVRPLAQSDTARAIAMGSWWLALHYDPETRELSHVEQRDGQTGLLVKRTSYAKWFISPSGQRLPGEVIVRTFAGNDRRPIVEVRYSGIVEAMPGT